MIFLTGKENMDETIEIKVTSEMAGKRLDVVLSEQCSDLTRSYINKLCKEERAADPHSLILLAGGDIDKSLFLQQTHRIDGCGDRKSVV